MTEQKVQFLINDHMTSYLRFFARLGFPYSKKVLALTHEKSEIVFPMSKWFNEDWSINEECIADAKANNLIGNLGTFHGMMEFHSTRPSYYVDFDSAEEMDRNATIMRAQIILASELGAEYQGPKILVVHPGASDDTDVQSYIERVVATIAPVLDIADEKNVQISFEPDLGRGKVYYHASARHFDVAATIVERLNALAPKRNLSLPVSLTFDFSHTFLENERKYERLEAIINQFGHLISYAHINFPVRFYIKKQGVPTFHKKLHLQSPVQQLWSIFMRTQDGHNGIYHHAKDEAFRNILKLLKEKTRIPEFGRINLEVGTRWDRGFNFFRSGASGYGTYKSLLLLDEIFNS